MTFDQDIVKLPYCHSTNDELMSLVHSGEISSGKVVYTTDQRKGKGQRGNIWQSEKGKNLAMSIAIHLNWPIEDLFLLNIISSLSVFRLLINNKVKDISVKWPNDVYVRDNKIAGILTENTIKGNLAHWAVIGIGININQMHFPGLQATSVKLETNSETDIDEVPSVLFKTIVDYFNYIKMPGQREALIKEYEKNMRWTNESHLFLSGNEKIHGAIKGITDEGNLKIQTDRGLRVFSKGNVQYLA